MINRYYEESHQFLPEQMLEFDPRAQLGLTNDTPSQVTGWLCEN